MKPGDIYTYYHKGHQVDYVVLLLSSDKVPGWETEEELWRCAQFQVRGDLLLFGAQIIIHTESELKEMKENGTLKIRSQK